MEIETPWGTWKRPVPGVWCMRAEKAIPAGTLFPPMPPGDRVALACGIDRHDTCVGLLDGRPCGCACHEEETT